jgi:CRISPR/Cas system-associated exonuclease Cas4 (RecB family)
MDINHISVSRQKTFEQCAQAYKYRYHLKLASPKPEPFYFIYGTIVHKIAELYVECKGEQAIGDICSEIRRGKIPIEEKDGKEVFCPEIPDDYAKKLVKHLRAIQNLTEKIGCEGIVEKHFLYDLDPPNKKCVKGFIDRLILKDKNGETWTERSTTDPWKAFIIDYKTTKKGKWRVNSDTVKTDLQLRAYARVVQREYKLPAENIKAALFYLEGENLVAAQYNDESLQGVEKELLAAFNMIQRSDPDKVWGRVGWHCKNCDYEQICPFYKEGAGEQKWDGNIENLGHTGWE